MSAETEAMEPGAKLKPWGNLSTSLVVTGREVDSATLIAELRITDSEKSSLPEGVGIYSGPGWATLTVDERHSKTADEQAAELISILSSRESAIDELKKAGTSVKVDMSGVAESGSGLRVSPNILARLAEWGVPLTFTTVRESGEDEEDPLSWLV